MIATSTELDFADMTDNNRRLLGLASLFEQLVRATYDRRGPSELQPAQWSALRYFERAGASARTVSGLAKFMGVTLGPASRAARALERRGLLASEKNSADGRSVIYTLTSVGQKRLGADPLIRLAKALGRLAPSDIATLSQSLVVLSDGLNSEESRQETD